MTFLSVTIIETHHSLLTDFYPNEHFSRNHHCALTGVGGRFATPLPVGRAGGSRPYGRSSLAGTGSAGRYAGAGRESGRGFIITFRVRVEVESECSPNYAAYGPVSGVGACGHAWVYFCGGFFRVDSIFAELFTH